MEESLIALICCVLDLDVRFATMRYLLSAFGKKVDDASYEVCHIMWERDELPLHAEWVMLTHVLKALEKAIDEGNGMLDTIAAECGASEADTDTLNTQSYIVSTWMTDMYKAGGQICDYRERISTSAQWRKEKDEIGAAIRRARDAASATAW